MKSWIVFPLLLAAVPTIATGQNVAAPVLNEARFEQVALTVTDVDAARSFYRDRLGLRLLVSEN
jgi:catechol-2,3-dioxygenase